MSIYNPLNIILGKQPEDGVEENNDLPSTLSSFINIPEPEEEDCDICLEEPSEAAIIIEGSECEPQQKIIINYGGQDIITETGNIVAGNNIVISGVLTNRLVGLGDIVINADLSNYYTITQLQTAGQAQVNWNNLTNIPDLSVTWENITGNQSVVNISGFTNDAGYITIEEVPPQVNADWNATSGLAQILNKPNLALVAISGDYNDLINKPDIPELLGYATEQWVLDQDYITSADIPAQQTLIWTATSGDLTISDGNTVSLDGRYSLLEHTHTIPEIVGLQTALDNKMNKSNTITSGYGIVASSDFEGPVSIEVNTDVLDNRYLRKDQNDTTLYTLTTGFLETGGLASSGTMYAPSIGSGTEGDQLVVRDSLGFLRTVDWPNFSSTFTVTSGSQSMDINGGDTWTFIGGGDTTVTINSTNKSITINSVPGSGTGGVLVSFNGRTDPAAVPMTGDYTTNMVPESGNLYFTTARVLATQLAGFSASNSAIGATDTILQAFGKAQGQINARVPTSRTISINGTTGNITVSGGSQDLSANRSWTINLATVGTSDTYTKVTTDTYGRVVSGTTLAVADIPNLPASKITSGVFNTARLGTGTANSSTVLYGNGTWGALPNIPGAQTLTFSSTDPGALSISSGNSVTINSLGHVSRSIYNEEPPGTAHGFYPYIHAAGATGYPTELGGGILFNRYSTATSNSGFVIERPTTGTGLYFNTITGDNEWGSWREFADKDWVITQIPAAQTLSTDFPNEIGRLTISGGNTVDLSSLRLYNRPVHDEKLNTSGFVPIYTAAGSTGYPAETGSGILINRFSTANSNSGMVLWTAQSGNTIYYNTFINDNVYDGWKIIADRAWVTDQIPTNYITSNSNQTGLSGNKTTSGVWTFSGSSPTGIIVDRTGTSANSSMLFSHPGGSVYIGNAELSTFAIGGSANIQASNWFSVSSSITTVNSTGGLKVSPTSTTSITPGTYTFEVARNSNGVYAAITGDSSQRLAILRGYAQNGIQLVLTEGGIDIPQAAGPGDTGIYFGGVLSLRVTSVSTVLSAAAGASSSSAGVYIRPQGDNISSGQVFIAGDGNVTINGLSGSGTRMVVATASGTLSTQSIPVSGVTQVNTGTHLSGGPITSTGTLEFTPRASNWIVDNQGNQRMYFGSQADTSNAVILRASGTGTFQFRNAANTSVWTVNNSGTLIVGTVPYERTSGVVPTSRAVNTGYGLTGGNVLTADRTISLINISAGSQSQGALRYNGTSRGSGQMYGGSTNPTSTTRLNYDGIFHAYDFISYGASDARLKDNITPISNPIEKLAQIGGYSFIWKEGHESYEGYDYGVIAQEVEKILPEIVVEREGIKAIKSGNQLTGLLIAAVNELAKKVKELENGIS